MAHLNEDSVQGVQKKFPLKIHSFLYLDPWKFEIQSFLGHPVLLHSRAVSMQCNYYTMQVIINVKFVSKVWTRSLRLPFRTPLVKVSRDGNKTIPMPPGNLRSEIFSKNIHTPPQARQWIISWRAHLKGHATPGTLVNTIARKGLTKGDGLRYRLIEEFDLY